MFKVVFIDDETLVKLGLRSMLNWEDEGFQIEGDASTGSEGLSLITETNPDLVITDIIMPDMNGIEMMQKVKENHLDPIFVVLSSYDQFELVKKAMKLGAKDYLLKLKLNREILLDMLETVKQELKNKGKTDWKNEPSVWQTEELRKAFLKKALLGESLLMEQSDFNLGWKNKPVRIVYIVSNVHHLISTKEETEKKIYLETICKLIKDISREFFDSYCTQWEKGEFLIFLSEEGAEDVNSDLNFMSEAIIDMLMQYSNIQASIGISGSVTGYENFKGAYLQAKSIKNILARDGYGKVVSFEDTMETDTLKTGEIANNFFSAEKLACICETLNLDELEQSTKRIVEEIRGKHVKLDSAAFLCTRFMCLMEEYLKQNWQNSFSGGNLNDLMKKLYHSDTIAEIIEVFNNYTSNIRQFFSEQGDNEQERIVREAKKYIREHVYDNISLKELAQVLFISSGYLSTTFSKYEPIGVANYINKVKIAEAQQLLMKQRLKIYEVAFKLGYENAGYFAKVFKKYTGCTPKEYMERK